MSMNSRFPQRDVTWRGQGPSVHAPGDGLEGMYSATLHTVPSGGTCQVVIPALGLTTHFPAHCSQAFTGSVGDMVLVAFDENKEAWVLSPSGVVEPTVPPALGLINSADVTHGLKVQAGQSGPTFTTGSPASVTVSLPTAWSNAHVAFVASLVAGPVWPTGFVGSTTNGSLSTGTVYADIGTAGPYLINWISIGY